MKKIFILVCSCALLAACNNSAKTNKSAGADSTSIEVTVYIERDRSFDEQGTYTLQENLLTLNAEGGKLSYYKVEENHLRKLTMDKQEITGELADHYVLNKE